MSQSADTVILQAQGRHVLRVPGLPLRPDLQNAPLRLLIAAPIGIVLCLYGGHKLLGQDLFMAGQKAAGGCLSPLGLTQLV